MYEIQDIQIHETIDFYIYNILNLFILKNMTHQVKNGLINLKKVKH